MSFRVELEIFRGPLDLLLYLVRKHEVEIADIPIAPITTQFLEYIELLRELDLNQIGDFLDMASTLLEIKSRLVLPHGGEEAEELPDPRDELVRRLLEYKRYKDAASMLEERARSWQERFPRLGDDLPPRTRDLAEEEIREVELWDLVSAFGRIMRDNQAVQPSNIVYDDTPIHVYMAQIQEQLAAEGRLRFQGLFRPGMHKSALVGIFLAVLELVRNYHVRTDQNDLFGEIWIMPGEAAGEAIKPEEVDNYDRTSPEAKPAKPKRSRGKAKRAPDEAPLDAVEASSNDAPPGPTAAQPPSAADDASASPAAGRKARRKKSSPPARRKKPPAEPGE